MNEKRVNVATIDTLLSFYLAFIFANKPYFDKSRILCISSLLFDVQQHNRLKQSGLLKRFSMKCYGKQDTLDSIRAKKAKMFTKLKKGSAEYEEWFLKYNPANNPKLRRKISPPSATKTTETHKENITYEIVDTKTHKTAKNLRRLPKRGDESETKTTVAFGDDATTKLSQNRKTRKARIPRKWGKPREGFLYGGNI